VVIELTSRQNSRSRIVVLLVVVRERVTRAVKETRKVAWHDLV
jgi:hypothetical protein